MDNFLQKILGSDKADTILSYLPKTDNTNQYSFFSVLFILISILPVALIFVVIFFILYGAYKVARSDGDPKKHEAGITTVKRAVFSFFFLFLIIVLTNAFSLAILGKTALEGLNAFQVCAGTINGVTGDHLVLEYFRAGVDVPSDCTKITNATVALTACQSCILSCGVNISCYTNKCTMCSFEDFKDFCAKKETICNSLPKPEERDYCKKAGTVCGAG